MKKLFVLILYVASAIAQLAPLRPPAVPLIAHDPYFSVWSMADRLTDEPTKHWTGSQQTLGGIMRIDGKGYRFMGTQPRNTPAMNQVSLQLSPTRTVYVFEAAGVRLTNTFFTPAFPTDLDVLSRPVTYLSWDVESTDAKTHDVALYFESSPELAVNTNDQTVMWARQKMGDMEVLRTGTTEQPVLGKVGDNLRIDWGFHYLALPPQAGKSSMIVTTRAGREEFFQKGTLPDTDEVEMPRAANRNAPLLAAMFQLGTVGAQPVSRHVLLAYDDVFGIQYFQRNLRSYWRRNGMTFDTLLHTAVREYPALLKRGAQFDSDLLRDLTKAGGERYARIAVVAFRQTLAAHKLVADLDGTPLYFSKENFSNGCIDTVDVTYPSAPFFLYFNTALLKAQLKPVLDYASLPRWRWPFAPHDLGTYPLANGQVYGGGERTEENQMPVEESGNLLILLAAIAKKDGNAEFAVKYWPVLQKWAEYLREKGMDPENQLSTDDFAGHLAHNTNLSLKAIIALGGFANLSDLAGKKSEAASYRKAAQEMAGRWVEMAADGDHYKLAFDKPGTWSQKYNLVWDGLLGLNLFPAAVVDKEIAYYKTKQNRYGLPLDNRETYTKLDWILWTATLARNQADFDALVTPVYNFLNETPTRVPMTDWYWTIDGKQRGFQARSVVGGVFIKMLR
jgi:hypothetical protein